MSRRDFLLFVGPSVVIMVMLMIVPLVAAIILGFNQITFQNVTSPIWVGFDNYIFMLQSPEFWSSLSFTLIYIVVTVPVQIFLGLFVALLLDQVRAFRGVYIAATLMPFIVTPIVGTLIFRQSFDSGSGIYPWILENYFGIDYNFFLPDNIRFIVFFHSVWYVTPFAIVTLYAGLKSVPQEALEAARVDGANWGQRLWSVVIPYLRSLFIFVALITIMDSYRVFDSIFVLTEQNALYNNIRTLMYYNYQVAIEFRALGRANAMSVLTVIGVLVILIPFLYLTYKQQTEDS